MRNGVWSHKKRLAYEKFYSSMFAVVSICSVGAKKNQTPYYKGLELKRDVFVTAQNYVKSKNLDPKYWVSFIMVDSLLQQKLD